MGTTDSRPNVLFILTDDQRWDTVSALGNPHIETPNLDGLVERGFVFRNAYCMGGFCPAVCLPARMMTLRGRSWFSVRDLPEGFPNLPRSMKEAGYATSFFGKRGNSDIESQECFETTHYLRPEDLEAVIAKYPRDEERLRRDGAQGVLREGTPGKNLANRAIEWLDAHVAESDGRPFMMYLGGPAPHDPRIAPRGYLDQYPPDEMPLPANYLPFHPFDNGELFVRDEKLAAWPRTKDEIRGHLRDYYAVITHLDQQIGRIIERLEDLGEYENTIIVFSSDQGLAVGSHGLMGKQNCYEHTLKVPLIFAGPGVEAGESEAFAYLHDIYPTICDLVGAPVPDGLEGRSLVPIMRGERATVRDTVFLGYMGVQRAVRRGNWKLIHYPEIGRAQLFDLAEDPDELNDLAQDPAHAKTVARLRVVMAEQQALYGDDQARTVAEPKPGDVTIEHFQQGGGGLPR